MKIGFFDSGLGGLAIMHAVIRLLPQYDYEFYGDTANLPYGEKTEDEIFAFTKQGIEHLFRNDCALVIIACNTASAETLRRLQDGWLPVAYPDRKILGVIIPMVEEVVTSDAKEAVLIATTRTVASKKYDREFAKFAVAPTLTSIATPGLVPLIESGKLAEAVAVVSPIIGGALQRGSALILGCTHYALLKPALLARFGNETKIFSPTEIIPYKLAEYLDRHTEIKNLLSQNSTEHIHLSDIRSDYMSLITHFQTDAI